MSRLDALLVAVHAAPDDDAPRRAFANAVRGSDPARAQLIDLQLAARATRRQGGTPSTVDQKTATELVRQHAQRWAGELHTLTPRYWFWGGFPEHVEIAASALLANASRLTAAAPVRHLRLTGSKGLVRELASLPLMEQLASLDLTSNGIDDVDVGELVASPRLHRIRKLILTANPISLDAHRAIARASLSSLRFVEAAETAAPLVIRAQDWSGDTTDVAFTRARGTLVQEVGHRPWLDALDEPSLDVV